MHAAMLCTPTSPMGGDWPARPVGDGFSLASLACASPPDGEHHAITRRPAAVQNWRAGRPAGVEELPTTHIYPQASLPPPEARLVPFGALVERKEVGMLTLCATERLGMTARK